MALALTTNRVARLVQSVDRVAALDHRRPGTVIAASARLTLFPHYLAGLQIDALREAVHDIHANVVLVDNAAAQSQDSNRCQPRMAPSYF